MAHSRALSGPELLVKVTALLAAFIPIRRASFALGPKFLSLWRNLEEGRGEEERRGEKRRGGKREGVGKKDLCVLGYVKF